VGLFIADAGIDEARAMLAEVKRREEHELLSTTTETYHALLAVNGSRVAQGNVDAIWNDFEKKTKYILQRALGAINALQELISSKEELEEFKAQCSSYQQTLRRKASEEQEFLNSLAKKWKGD